MNILIVDDKTENLYILETMLKARGFGVISASNGAEALERARMQQVDLAVSDILMPVMDGFTLCREWRKDPQLCDVPFIFYTATYTDPKDEEFALGLGADRFVVKPKEFEELLELIKETLAHHEYGKTRAIAAPAQDEQDFLRQYSEVLVRKLENKVERLEQAEKLLSIKNAALEKDIEERKRIEAALRESREQYRLLFESSLDAILLTSPDGSIFSANPAACSIFQRTEEDICSRGRNGVVDRSDTRLNAALEARRLSGHFRGELNLVRKDGTTFPSEISSSVFRNSDGAERTSMIIRDITDRKRSEREIRHLNELYDVLSQCNEAIVRIHTRAELFREICRNTVQRGHFRMAWMGMLDRGTNLLRPVMWEGVEDGFLDEVFEHVNEQQRRTLPAYCAIDRQRIAVVNDIEHDPTTMEWRQAALKRGYRSVASTPLMEQNSVIGTFTLYSSESGYFGEKESDLLNEMALDLSFALDTFEQERRRRQAETTLQQSNAFNEFLLRSMPFAMDIIDEQGTILFMNDTMKRLTGPEALGKRCWTVYKDDRQQCAECPLKNGITIGRIETKEVAGVLGGRTYHITHSGLLYEQRKAMLEIFLDVTEQKRLQQQVFQSQKIQSIGTLASGIAHDFNNILGIILVYSSMMQRGDAPTEKIPEYLASISNAVKRGAALVRQILTFARQTGASFQSVVLTDLLRELVSMLNETFPKIIEIRLTTEPMMPILHADHTQIHQLLLNLCVNARDAMPNGGVLTISAHSLPLGAIREKFPTADHQRYVRITISDTGTGMDNETKSRIFDPFFTTKDVGQGTGLGLSVVFGVVQSHHGFIDVDSTPGAGTTFIVYLPIPMGGERDITEEFSEQLELSRGSETILVVEDEAMLMDILKTLLESNGYTVLSATNGTDAVALYCERSRDIALVLTDVGLPKMTGIEVFAQLKQFDPDVRVLLASGFLPADTKSDLLRAGARGFIQKPYEVMEILHLVRKALDEKGGAA